MFLIAALLTISFTHPAAAAPSSFLKRMDASATPVAPVTVDPDAFLKNSIIIDPSCAAAQPHMAHLKQAVKDVISMTLVAQSMQKTDVAFNKYFIPDNTNMVEEDPNDPEEKDFDTIQKMFRAILTPSQKITLKCPSEKDLPNCKGTLALTTQDPKLAPTIDICPAFFQDAETIPSLPDKTFDQRGWCTPSPHKLGDFSTGGHTLLHELTHIPMIAIHADIQPQEVTDPKTNVKTMEGGTRDILGSRDENDGRVLQTYKGGDKRYAPIAAIVLQQHWIKYLTQPKGRGGVLKEPPLGTTENAESYAAAATEYFFYQKCKHLGLDPNKITVAP